MKTVYIADDGTQFNDEFECGDYEWKLAHPKLKKAEIYSKDGTLLLDVFDEETYKNASTIIVRDEEMVKDFQALAEYTGFVAYGDITEPGIWEINDKGYMYLKGKYEEKVPEAKGEDSERISRIISLLEQGWRKKPDWRFGQLIENFKVCIGNPDIFYLKDDDIEHKLANFFEIKTIHDIAKQLNGRQYTHEITPDEEKEIKKLGFVVVFGYSDDIAEFCGAISDERDCFKARRIFKENGFYVDVKRGKDGYMWQYSSNIPHATFDIFDGDEKWCKGIVFDYNKMVLGK